MKNKVNNFKRLMQWSLLGATLIISTTTQAANPGSNAKNLSLDQRLQMVADKSPAFGGMFYDKNGDLNVYLTNPNAKTGVMRALKNVFGNELLENNPNRSQHFKGKPTVKSGDFKVLKAKFNIKQLGKWKKSAGNVFALKEVSFIDLDEAKNRVTIGITDKAMQTAVEDILLGNGVPLDAVNIVITEEATAMTHSLRSTRRPTKGGNQIQFTNGTGKSTCTLGFNAYRLGVRGFVTNSHCTETRGGTEGTMYYQATTNYVGVELADPNYYTSIWYWNCPWFKRCRYSDSAFIRYDGSDSSSFGRISRTTSYNGSLTIDSTRPEFRIIGERASNFVGSVLDKVGRTTGWTYGTVTATCVDTNVSNSDIHMKCQDTVERAGATLVAGGDSGSPVFVWGFGDTVRLSGILWGSAGSSKFFLSPMRFIESELGSLATY